MSRRIAARFLPALLLALAVPAAAQDDDCSMEASVRAEPIQQIPADAPILAPLRWTMTRDQARRALTADGWRRDASAGVTMGDYFDGEFFGHDADLIVLRNSASRIIRAVVFIHDDQTFIWSRTLWDEVTGVLHDGYGAPTGARDATPRPYGGTSYCSAFSDGGGENVRVEWETLFARMGTDCQVSVFYNGPGWPAHVQAGLLDDARAADRTCRADIARVQRDRNRLAPGAPPRRSDPRGPTRQRTDTAYPPPPPAGPLEFSEVSPEIIGGLPALQQNVPYPDFDLRAGTQGTVSVRFVVTPEGRAENVEVVRSVSPGLDAAAIAGVQRTRFTPGRQDGQAVSVRMTVPVRFTIR